MISTRTPDALPHFRQLRKICKAIAVMDACLDADDTSRYYSYDHNWSPDEELFEFCSPQGYLVVILFQKSGCVINGYAPGFAQQDRKKLTKGLPSQYRKFLSHEIVSDGTTFCIWTDAKENWSVGDIQKYKDSSSESLQIFSGGHPLSYVEWAKLNGKDHYKKRGIPLDTVSRLYDGEPLTKEMVLSLVNTVEHWDKLKEAIENTIGYPCAF